jgi:glutamine amidotransferase
MVRPSPLFQGWRDGASVYFVHSYHCIPNDAQVVTATADYGGAFVAAVQRDNIVACQFHPEKSQAVGLRLLDNFARWTP